MSTRPPAKNPKIRAQKCQKIETEEEEEEEKTRRRRNKSRRLFVPDEEKARSQKRDWQDGIAGRSLAESGYQNVERRKVLEPPRKNHGIFPGARLPRDEPFFEEEEKVSSSSFFFFFDDKATR